MEQLGWTLIHFLWQGALIAALAALCFAVLRDARWRYAIGVAGLALMAVSPMVTWMSMGSAGGTPVRFEVLSILPGAPPEGAGGDASMPVSWVAWLPLVWACGASLLSVRVLLAWWMEQRAVRSAQPLSREWLGRIELVALAAGVPKRWRAAVSAKIAVPQVSGVFRPLLLLPASALAQISPDQLEAIVAHELAHIRRHDYLVNLMQTAVECLLFYHPAVWWLSARVRQERELCCDAAAVEYCGDRAAYAKALLALEEARPTLAMAASGGGLRDRVASLLGHRTSSSFALPGLAVLLVAASVAWAARAQEPAPPPPAAAPAAPRMVDGGPSNEIREQLEQELARVRNKIAQIKSSELDSRAKVAMESELQAARAEVERALRALQARQEVERELARVQEKIGPEMERAKAQVEQAMIESQRRHEESEAEIRKSIELAQAKVDEQVRVKEALRQELATPYNKWLREDVAYLVSEQERIAFMSLQSDAEREKFIEQFWQRRDPTPGTAANEFKEEHYRRIAYANERFAGGTPGWRSDRGRVYISLGPPDEIESHPDMQTEEWKYNTKMSGTARHLKFEGPRLRLVPPPPPPPPPPAPAAGPAPAGKPARPSAPAAVSAPAPTSAPAPAAKPRPAPAPPPPPPAPQKEQV